MVHPNFPEMRQAFRDYYQLDPQVHADPDQLLELAEAIDQPDNPIGQRGSYMNVAANLHLELGVQPTFSLQRQEEHLARAGILLTTMNDGSDEYAIDHTLEAEVYRAHLPVLLQGHSPAARRATYGNLSERVSTLADKSGPEFDLTKGVLVEHKVALLVGYTGLRGLTVEPSLERQNRNDVLVEDEDGVFKPYRWDLTIWSDGSEIGAGEYRAQVKSQSGGSYHSDIARVNASEFGIPSSRPEMLADACRKLVSLSYNPRLPRDLQRSRNTILRALDKVGPITETPTDKSSPDTPSELRHQPFLDLLAS